MRCWRAFVISLIFVGAVCRMPAQKEQRQPLTEAQVDKIREAGIFPDERIGLYTKFMDEHAETIKGLTNRRTSGARGKRIDDELLDLTALMDELGSNLDQYSERKADIRASLRKLSEAAPKWLGILRALAGEPTFDEARKEAIEAGEELSDEARRLLSEQTAYFETHKQEKGQERAEPN
jgi:DNA gyrase/topoisomerase IV subunit A